MKQYVGIDVSSQKLNINYLKDGESFDYVIPNEKSPIKDFIKKYKLDKNSTIIGAESTGRYHLKCMRVFVREGYQFKLINPILTNNKINSSIRKTKTDKTDARLIVNILMQGDGRLIKEDQLDESRRALLRTEKRLVEYKSNISRLKNDLKKVESNKKTEKALEQIDKVIDQLKDSIKSIEAEAIDVNNRSEPEELVDSVPGFAQRLSAVVVSEVQDFSRFPSARQFKAYVGIDSRVIESGTVKKLGRMTKRGNKYLRYAFYLAAQVARQHDPELKAFYAKKLSEGKHHTVAVCAVSRKLCERVFATVKRGTPYVKYQLP